VAASPVRASRLAWNSLLTLASRGLTLVLGLVFVPLLIRSLGMELYGLLAITWMVLGQLGWMDLGFSAACTRFVSHALARHDPSGAARWAWTSMAAQAVIGGIGTLVLWAAAPSIVAVMHVQPGRVGLAVLTLRLFALMIPVDLVTRSLSGVLEAAQRFGMVGGLALFSSLVTNAVYVVGIARGGDFLAVVYGLVVLRGVTLVATFLAARHVLPELVPRERFPSPARLPARMREMLGFGGWVTVNSAVGPALLYFDRWLIGVLLGVAALPYFTVPFNLVMQLMLIPGSVTAPLFPAFTALRAGGGGEQAQEYYVRSQRYLLVVVLPLQFVLFVWAPEILRLWVGADFAAQAAGVLRLLVAALMLGLLAPVSGALLQGAGRPDLLSRVYLAELPINAVMMWLLVRRWGIEGAAAGFALRMVVETLLLWAVVHREFRWRWTQGVGRLFGRAGAAVAGMAAMAAVLRHPQVTSPFPLGATLLALVAYALFARRFLLDRRDEAFLLGVLRLRPRNAG
jgi:O-antigen/teichoic acid export membrane protein